MFKILVVEDDRDLNRSVCSFLTANGYETTDCLNANEAYDAMYENVYDLIISDIMMPEIDGFEFAKTVRSLNEDVPILFMTARDDLAAKQRGFRAGIDDYMVKPVDEEEIVRRLGMAASTAHEVLCRMADEGVLFSMGDRDDRRFFLSDRPGWVGIANGHRH